MSRAELDKQPSAVAAMFDNVASRYDVTNDVLALGQTRRWRRLVADALEVRAGQRILDLAAGTGTSAAAMVSRGAEVVACDFSLGMLQVGRSRLPEMRFVAGDAMALPFADDSFDAVTISFGLRNIQDPGLGLQEMRRVVKPGGRLVICEFSTPTWPPFRQIYTEYLMKALPAMAKRVSSNSSAYEYLAESIAAWPDQQGLAALVVGSGWRDVQWRNVSGGIVALHRGVA